MVQLRMAPRARFELARDFSHGLSRPALYQAKRPRLMLGVRVRLLKMNLEEVRYRKNPEQFLGVFQNFHVGYLFQLDI